MKNKKPKLKGKSKKKRSRFAEALKAQIASNVQDKQEKQETVNLKESTTTTMSHPKKIINAEKTKQYREYTVREHQRKLYEREYKFVCSGCDKIVERTSYALCCPTYGMECGGKKSKCRRFTK